MNRITGIQMAVDRMGGSPSKLASSVGGGVRRQHVEHWLKVGRVPAERSPDVERVTGVLCEQLCPGVDWAYLRGTAANDQAREVA